MIRKYSSSYINNRDNFAIIYSDNSNKPTEKFKQSDLYGVFCVIQNIIQRGTPTLPSKFLNEELKCEDILASETEYYWVSKKPSSWEKTIKGSTESSDYPALIFFNETIPEYLGEYSFIRNLIIPEARFEDVVGEKTAFAGQQVDFYCPVLSLVVEIDGSSHNEKKQVEKDRQRDTELGRHGIRILRIKAYDIKNNTSQLKQQMAWLKGQLIDSNEVQEYRSSLNNKHDYKVAALETIMRLQMLLLLCLMNQVLDLKQSRWTICFSHSEVKGVDKLLMTAYEDLKLWMTAITTLLKIDIKYPSIEITGDQNQADIVIDFGILKRYDDMCNPSEKEYIIRTDYYRGKDYYQVAVSDTLTYKLRLEKPSEDLEQLDFLLVNLFDYNEGFNDGQLPVLANVLEGHDTIGILPTGGGKSLCYQFSALLQPGVTIIVDPIISLMRDQRRSMRKKHIDHNEMVSSMQTGFEKGSVLQAFQKGRYQMMWVSPERFQTVEFRESLIEINRKLNFCIAVIDEVHCLSEWGHDFRVSYLALIRTIKEYCPAAILLGLTATASEFVLTDIRVEFGGEEGILDYTHVKTLPSLNRPKLHFIRATVRDEADRNKEIQKILSYEFNDKKSGLVFCPTIKGRGTGCFAMSKLLSVKYNGQYRLFYGSMSQKEKAKNQEDYMDGVFPVMICTKAFGMGIDKEDIRYTIHDALPQSIEAFYQEAGRAGRDGEHANCYIVYKVGEAHRGLLKRLPDDKELLALLNDDYKRRMDDSDLSTPLYFLRTNHVEEVSESRYIAGVLSYLKRSNVIPFQQNNYDSSDYKQKLETALYKLSLLGFVNSWTVQYQSLYRGSLTVDCIDAGQSGESYALNNFVAYVKKYETDFSLDSDAGLEYKAIYNQSGNKNSNAIQMLVRWINQNILLQRIRCIRNMALWCSPEVDDVSFREYLNGYFSFNDKTIILEHIAHNPWDIEKWVTVFYVWNEEKTKVTGLISKKEAREIYASLQRFLESYRNNAGLNYLDGLLQLFIESSVSRDELKRMERSFEAAQRMGGEIQKTILEETLEIGKTIDSVDAKDMLSQILIDYYPNEVRNIFNSLQDRYSLSHELGLLSERMENIKWII